MPSCILLIIPVWTSHQIVISANNDRFFVTETLHKKGCAFWTAHLNKIKTSCTDAVREKVINFMSSSNEFKQEYETSKTVLQKGYIEENEIRDFKQKSRLMKIHLQGIVASWLPPEAYKPACLLDYCRFHILRPLKAEVLEQNGWWRIKMKDKTGQVTREKRVTDKKV